MEQGKTLNAFVTIILAGMLFAGIIEGGTQAIQGFLRLQVTPARLVSDFVAIAGVESTLINVSTVGFLGYVFLAINRLKLSGASLAALFTMMGFAFFGKTLFNCLPIMLGVSLSA
ncbi:MAG TPA: DUF1576 domain-containing protein, partial [Rectinema sp.]|nr:DUF1576 domain-containing protein [Rectinema sp.]HPW46689.1 DUF1576 domain-containing protein [Rectinema sp.]